MDSVDVVELFWNVDTYRYLGSDTRHALLTQSKIVKKEGERHNPFSSLIGIFRSYDFLMNSELNKS